MSKAHTDTKTRATAVLGALAATAALGAAPAQAAGPAPAVCVTTFTAAITPGFTPTPGSGKLSSRGMTGALDCFGTIGGKRIRNAPGSMGFVERHSAGTCGGHRGTGRVHLIIPTTAGNRDLVGRLSVRRTGFAVRVTVRFPRLRFSGSGVVFPRMGDCATTPLEQIKVTITGTLTPTRGG